MRGASDRWDDRWELILASALSLRPVSFSKLEDALPSTRVSSREQRARLLKEMLMGSVDVVRVLAEVLSLSEEEITSNADRLSVARSEGVRVYTPLSEGYPLSLLELRDPPVLIARGRLQLSSLEHGAIAVVGTRRASRETLRIAEEVSTALASRGSVVISGLARGVDAMAHRGALSVGGMTVAILGCGLEVTYPKENAQLRQRILQEGLLISEYPMNARPERWRFPLRNRIIAGLSRAVVVIGAPERSGALITARIGAELSREVFALFRPGSEHEGARRLVREGLATPFSDVSELIATLKEMGLLRDKRELDGLAGQVIELIASGSRTLAELVDELCERGLSPSRTMSIIGQLESEGLIGREGGLLWVRDWR